MSFVSFSAKLHTGVLHSSFWNLFYQMIKCFAAPKDSSAALPPRLKGAPAASMRSAAVARWDSCSTLNIDTPAPPPAGLSVPRLLSQRAL